jgi:hypothetical protein
LFDEDIRFGSIAVSDLIVAVIAQSVERKMRNFLGHKFWERKCFIATAGRHEEVIRVCIRNKELPDTGSA